MRIYSPEVSQEVNVGSCRRYMFSYIGRGECNSKWKPMQVGRVVRQVGWSYRSDYKLAWSGGRGGDKIPTGRFGPEKVNSRSGRWF